MKAFLISFITTIIFSVNVQAQKKHLNTLLSSNELCHYSSKTQIYSIVGFYDWLANVDDKNKWFVGEKADLNTNGYCNTDTTYHFNFNHKPTDTNILEIPSLEERLLSSSKTKYQYKKNYSYNTNLGLDFRFNL